MEYQIIKKNILKHDRIETVYFIQKKFAFLWFYLLEDKIEGETIPIISIVGGISSLFSIIPILVKGYYIPLIVVLTALITAFTLIFIIHYFRGRKYYATEASAECEISRLIHIKKSLGKGEIISKITFKNNSIIYEK